MSLIPFQDLPDGARLWAFHADRALSDDETARLRSMLEPFVDAWAAHRKDLAAGYDLRYNQFVLLGVDESRLPASGCSIDSMVHALREAGAALGVELVDSPDVPFRDGEAVRCASRDEFERLAEAGAVTSSTIVFDRTAQNVGDLRNGRWERPAAEAWHARAFALR